MPDYHFVITLQWMTDNGPCASTIDGTHRVEARRSRMDVYREIVQLARLDCGIADGTVAVTMFFSLEPNRLTPAAPSTPLFSGPRYPGER